MIRWPYLLSRVVALIAIVVGLQLAVPPLMRWLVVYSLESASGWNAELSNVQPSLWRGEVCLSGLQLARPNDRDKAIVKLDSARFTVDLRELAFRRCIVDDASISGLVFGAPRNDRSQDGSANKENAPDTDPRTKQARAKTRQWLREATGMLEEELEQQFQSIRLARRMGDHWRREHEQLREEAAQLRRKAADLKQAFTRLNNNAGNSGATAINAAAELQKRWPDVLQLRAELVALGQRAESLMKQVQLDRAAIASALEDDRTRLRESIHLNDLDAAELSNYLLADEAGRWWKQLEPWLDATLWITAAPPANELGNRGKTIPFNELREEPDFLVRRAAVDGRATLAGQQAQFTGQLLDFSLPDAKANSVRPIQLKLATSTPFSAQLHAKIESINGTRRQEITLRCDDLALPTRRWGEQTGLQLSFAPGSAKIQARLIMMRELLDGRLRITHRGRPTIKCPAESAYADIACGLNAALANIDQIDVWVDLCGSVDTPSWSVRSTLAKQLHEPLQQAAQQWAANHAAQLELAAERQLDRQWSQLQDEMLTAKAEWETQLGAGTQAISDLAAPLAGQLPSFQNLLRRF